MMIYSFSPSIHKLNLSLVALIILKEISDNELVTLFLLLLRS